MHRLVPILALLGALLPVGPAAAQDIRTERVHFPAGATGTSLKGTITGYQSVSYMVGAEAGQHLTVTLSPSNLATYFNVYAPGSGPGDAAMANSGLTGSFVPDLNRFAGTLPSSGEYTVSVYMVRAAARRDERSDYILDIGITGSTGAAVTGDYADGLAGGPDFFRVRTTGGAPLNLRSGPTTGAGVVAALPDGTGLRNLGCRMAEGRRWCHVATLADPGQEGWAAGDFLIESDGSTPAVPAGPTTAAAPPGEAGGTSSVTVRFPPGASGTTLDGALAPGESRRHVLGARSGQVLSVTVDARDPLVEYQIFNPDRSFLLDRIGAGTPYRGQLWQSGAHVIEIINRGTGSARYSVTFGIE